MRKAVVALVIAFAFIAQPLFAQPIKTLSGKVVPAESNEQNVKVLFKHPATGEFKNFHFQVSANTDWNEGLTLAALKSDEFVTVDYTEADGIFLARRIARVRLHGPPRGVE